MTRFYKKGDTRERMRVRREQRSILTIGQRFKQPTLKAGFESVARKFYNSIKRANLTRRLTLKSLSGEGEEEINSMLRKTRLLHYLAF